MSHVEPVGFEGHLETLRPSEAPTQERRDEKSHYGNWGTAVRVARSATEVGSTERR